LQSETDRKTEVRKDKGRIMGEVKVTSWVGSGETKASLYERVPRLCPLVLMIRVV
jgi:hypothetical protein